jgi:hypothetical protein
MKMTVSSVKNVSSVRLLLSLLLVITVGTGAAVAVDAGDNFADRPEIIGSTGQITGSTAGATREIEEPEHAGLPGGGSVWRSWTAPSTGPVTIDTLGSDFDTLLAVYVGTALNTLTVVASSDDIDFPTNVLSSVTFTAQTGVAYAIALDGFQGAAGNFVLNWEQAPATPSAFTLSLTATGYGRVRVNGSLEGLPYSGTFAANAQVTVEAVALGGWSFSGWTGDLTSAANPAVVKMAGDWDMAAQFVPDPSLSLVNVPWYVDNSGPAQFVPPQNGRTTTFVYLNNAQVEPLDCYIEYYTQDGVFVGPFDDNTFSVPPLASIAFRPVADDPSSVPGGQEAPLGQAVPNRPGGTENGNDGKDNGSIVIRFAGAPEVLTGQVRVYSGGGGYGAYSTAYSLPIGVPGTPAPQSVATLSVPWYVDNAGAAQFIPPRDHRMMAVVFLHNNRPEDLRCDIHYYTEDGIHIGPFENADFVIPANASIAFRPVADDPASVPGGQEAPVGRAVPNRPLGTDNGNDGKKNGSIRIVWTGAPTDVQGFVSSYSHRPELGSFAASSTLPPAVRMTTEE